jgi:hypothetical protein
MKTVELTPDELLPGSRRRRIYLQDAAGALHRFLGASIDRVVTVGGSCYEKCGKWSTTMYRCALPDSVEIVTLVRGLHQNGVFSGCMSYEDVIARIGAPRPVSGIAAWLRAEYPVAATKLDEISAQIDALEAEDAAPMHIREVAYGGFTRRQRHLHQAPIIMTAPDGRTARIEYDTRTGERTLTSEWCSLLEHQRLPGHGGGYVTMRIACPEGTRWEFADK